MSTQDIFDASEFVSKNNATLEYAPPCVTWHFNLHPLQPHALAPRYFRAFRRMDKTKPIFPGYTSTKYPNGVPWDNKFR